jgi:hypothetical protein
LTLRLSYGPDGKINVQAKNVNVTDVTFVDGKIVSLRENGSLRQISYDGTGRLTAADVTTAETVFVLLQAIYADSSASAANVYTPEAYGAVADGSEATPTDNTQAFRDLEAALAADSEMKHLVLAGDYGFTAKPTAITTPGSGYNSSPWVDPQHGLYLNNISDLVVEWRGKGCIRMNNATNPGNGTLRWGGHGVLIYGGCSNVWLINPNITGTTDLQALTRSNTYAPLSILSSQDSNTHPVDVTKSPTDIYVLNGSFSNSSGTGVNAFRAKNLTFMGTQRVENTRADGIHMHACTRTTGQKLVARNVEDDSLAFQAYGWTAANHRDGPGLQAQYYDNPTSLAVSNQGAAGAVTYEYFVAAVFSDGTRIPSASATTATGNATLDGTNFNRVTFTATSSAVGYELYGRLADGPPAFIKYATASPLDDKGEVPGDRFPDIPVVLDEFCNAFSSWGVVDCLIDPDFVDSGRAVPSVSEYFARTVGIGMGRDITIGQIISRGKNAALGVRANPYNGTSGFNYFPSYNIRVGEIDSLDNWFGAIRFYGQNQPNLYTTTTGAAIGAGAITTLTLSEAQRLPQNTKINVTNDAGTVTTCSVSSDMAASSVSIPVSSVTPGVSASGNTAVVLASHWAKVYGTHDVQIGRVNSSVSHSQVPRVTTCSTTNGSATLTITGTVPPDLGPDFKWQLSGAGIASGTYILDMSGSTVTMSDPATATAAGVSVKFTWLPSHRGIFVGFGGTNNQAVLGAAGKVRSATNSWLDGTRIGECDMRNSGLQVYNSSIKVGDYRQSGGIFRLTNDHWTSLVTDLRDLGSSFGSVSLQGCTVDAFYQRGVKMGAWRISDSPGSNIFGAAADGAVDYALNWHDVDDWQVGSLEVVRPNRHKRTGARAVSIQTVRRVTVDDYLIESDTVDAGTFLFVGGMRDSVFGSDKSQIIWDGTTMPTVSITGISGGRQGLINGYMTARSYAGAGPISQWVVQTDINSLGSSQVWRSGQRIQETDGWRLARFEHVYGSGNQWRFEDGVTRVNPGDGSSPYTIAAWVDVVQVATALTADLTLNLPALTTVRPGHLLRIETVGLGGFKVIVDPPGTDPIAGGAAGATVSLLENDSVYWFVNQGNRWEWGQVREPYVRITDDGAAAVTPVLRDVGRLVTLSRGSAQTITLASDATTAFPVGSVLEWLVTGAGTPTWAAGGGATVTSRSSLLSSTRYGRVRALKTAANSWNLTGDLA